MIKLTAQRSGLTTVAADVVACFIAEDKQLFKRQTTDLIRRIQAVSPPMDRGMFSGKESETLWLYGKKGKSKVLLLVGIGKTEKLTIEKLRRAAAIAVKSAQKVKAKTLALITPEPAVVEVSEDLTKTMAGSWQPLGVALGEGAALSGYSFDKYFTKRDEKKPRLRSVLVACDNQQHTTEIAKGLRYASVVCEATCLARDLGNAPGNEIYPETLAEKAEETGMKFGFDVTVFNEERIAELKMGGLLGVSQGSSKPPRFIQMELNGGNDGLPTVVLVGKGVTFDSGGISIKPSSGMAEMKMDMSGAAAVIGTMQAAARLKLPVHLVGLVPATENMLSGAALKPGDVIRHYNGGTSEVDNTDAEGRLILADALAYAAQFKPDAVIDLATLTGACVVALGHYATGMMGNDQKLMDDLKTAGERAYERVWQLPMFDEYEKLVKSDIADVKNVGGRWGGAITAGMFLKKFIGDYKWVHLDIAGTAILDESLPYTPKGGSGVGVRLLVDFLQNWKRGDGSV